VKSSVPTQTFASLFGAPGGGLTVSFLAITILHIVLGELTPK
jgi:CBS domain containing-hemolysin-like protein